METAVMRVSIEARYKAARFRVRVQASSILRALSLVKAFYYSAEEVTVVFPIVPEGFFVEGPLAPEGLIETGKSREQAA